MIPYNAERRPLTELSDATIFVESAILTLHKVPPGKDNSAELLAVLDIGRFCLNVCAPLARDLGYSFDTFKQLYERCQDEVRPWVEKVPLVGFEDRRTNILILDLLYELQAEVRQLKERLPVKRRKTVLTVVSGERRAEA